MANPSPNLSAYLAENILVLRKKRNLSQHGLARLAEIPRSTLTYLESGQGNPSLSNLVKVATALNVSLEELLVVPRPKVRLTPFASLPQTKRGRAGAVIYELLPDPIPGMQMERMELAPQAFFGGIPHLAGTKEYFTCIQGEISITVSGEVFRLRQGDVLSFPGDSPHSYRNTVSQKALGFSVVVLAPQHTL